MRDRLSLLIDHAAATGRSNDLKRARAAAEAYAIGCRLRRTVQQDSRIAAAIDDVLAVVWLLEIHDDTRPRDPETGLKFSDAALIAALQSSRTMTAAARKLGCDPKTINRRLKRFTGHSNTMSDLAGAPSLHRSKTMKIHSEQKT